MAEIILTALLPFVFEKVVSAASNKVARSKEIQSQLKKLERSLPPIQALLNDAAEKEIQDIRVKKWLNDLQHLAYDIDDVLDSLATDAIHRDLTDQESVVKKLIPTCCNSSCFSSSSSATKMHDKLNDITSKLQQLYDEKNNLGLAIKDKRSKNINRIYQTSLFDSPNNIVGREVEKEVILQKLLGDEPCDQNNFSIVPIVGMGGVGKTTLARLLYNEPKVNQHFDHKAWVCVSDEFDSFNIDKLIYESIADEEKKFENPNRLQEALRNKLAGKRFLLVLDDVWSEKIEDWNTLVPPFHAVAPGSKIIITTRKKKLLQQLGNDNPYHLNKLSNEDALSLFAQHSVGATNFDSYPTLRSYGEGIVQKCDGLPLALKSLGTSLNAIKNEEDWKERLNSKIWSLKDEGGILPALRLSYHELSACLKQLFAYSSLFPKDYMFEKEDLILLWMAEGFLHESTTSEPMEMERLGEKYFDELVSKSFIENVNNDRSFFVMHDLINDLATFVAGEFFIRLDIEMKNKTEEHSLKKYRHMSFVREEFMACKKFKEFEGANSLRTFLAVPVVVRNRWEIFYLSNKILVDLFFQLPLLRVLSLSEIEIDEIPKSVGDLKHLRYLNLSKTPITYLPETVCNLYNLQTLLVFGCHNLSKLPDGFSKLKSLRHFDIRDTPLLKNMQLDISEMKSLRTLSKIVIGGKNEFPINKLKNLKNLRRRVCIHGLDKLQNNDQELDVNLSQMKLSELVAEWSDVFDGSRNQRLEKEVLDMLKPHRDNLKNLEIMSYGGTEFPKWVGDSTFCNLTVVRMYECRNCMFLPPLGQLPSLKKLFIRNMDELKEVRSDLLGNGPAAFPSLEILSFQNMPRWEVWSVNAVGVTVFPCLKQLYIHNCPNMVRWEVWSSANANVVVFPCLEVLRIDNCPKLAEVSLEELPSMRVLTVYNCGEGVLKSLVGVASSVTKFSISGISGLSDEVWGGVVQYLGALEELSIWNCDEIRYLWGTEEAEASCKEVFTNLNKLFIKGCDNLVRLGGKEKDGSNLLLLTSLRIWNCDKLECLSCPNSIEMLELNDCSSITRVSFPTGLQKLKTIRIEGCNDKVLEELDKQVLNVISNTNIPVLEVVFISKCQYMKSITKLTSSFVQLTKLEIRSCPKIIESFPNLQNLASLKHLEIRNCPSMDGPPPLRSGGGAGVWPPKLDSLEIGELKRPVSEWGPLPASLVELTLWGGYGSMAEEEDEDDVKSFPTSSLLNLSTSSSSLTTLWLCDFKELERISSEGLQRLTSLRHLFIWFCPKMKDLPETLLPSLLSLDIYDCPNEELKEKMTSRKGSYWPLLSHIPQVSIYNV